MYTLQCPSVVPRVCQADPLTSSAFFLPGFLPQTQQASGGQGAARGASHLETHNKARNVKGRTSSHLA